MTDAFAGEPLSFAQDDGVAFPGWAPPPLTEDAARTAHENGERYAVIAGDPTSPTAALSLDGRNGRIAFTVLAAAGFAAASGRGGDQGGLVAAFHRDRTGAFPLAETRVAVGGGGRLQVRRVTGGLLRIQRRPADAPLWLVEQVAGRDPDEAEAVAWPEFGSWSGLTRTVRDPRGDLWDPETIDDLGPVDADAWLLDVIDERETAVRWRELARQHDAPRAVGLNAAVQEKLATERNFTKGGGGWRRVAEIDGVKLTTSVAINSSAGGACTVALRVVEGRIDVGLPLPTATARLETMQTGAPHGSPSPRPSAGSQVAVGAVLDLAEDLHEGVAARITDGGVPAGWRALAAR